MHFSHSVVGPVPPPPPPHHLYTLQVTSAQPAPHEQEDDERDQPQALSHPHPHRSTQYSLPSYSMTPAPADAYTFADSSRTASLTRPLTHRERELLGHLDRLKLFLATAPNRWPPASTSASANSLLGFNSGPTATPDTHTIDPANTHAPGPLGVIPASSSASPALTTGAGPSSSHPALNRFLLPSSEFVSCVLWGGLYHITGTDIVRALVFRFEAFGRPVRNMKKFEEGVFSDLRNLKPGQDACLEEPKSPFLDLLFKYQCIRTQKKQKVFYWFSVPHDRLFLDALERDLKREKSGQPPTTVVVGEPALSFSYDPSRSLYDQFCNRASRGEDGDEGERTDDEEDELSSGQGDEVDVSSSAKKVTSTSSNRLGASSGSSTSSAAPPPPNSLFLNMFSLFEGSPTYKQRKKKSTARAAYQAARAAREAALFSRSSSTNGSTPSALSLHAPHIGDDSRPSTAHSSIPDSIGVGYGGKDSDMSAAAMFSAQAKNELSSASAAERERRDREVKARAKARDAHKQQQQVVAMEARVERERMEMEFAAQHQAQAEYETTQREMMAEQHYRQEYQAHTQAQQQIQRAYSTPMLPSGLVVEDAHFAYMPPMSNSGRASPDVNANTLAGRASYEVQHVGGAAVGPYELTQLSSHELYYDPSAIASGSGSAPNHYAVPLHRHHTYPTTSSPYNAQHALHSMHGSSTPYITTHGDATAVSGMEGSSSTTPAMSIPYNSHSPSRFNGNSPGANNKVFPCPVYNCGKMFKRMEHLKRHQRTHTLERPYQCERCLKRFSRSDNLQQHLRTHARSDADGGSQQDGQHLHGGSGMMRTGSGSEGDSEEIDELEDDLFVPSGSHLSDVEMAGLGAYPPSAFMSSDTQVGNVGDEHGGQVPIGSTEDALHPTTATFTIDPSSELYFTTATDAAGGVPHEYHQQDQQPQYVIEQPQWSHQIGYSAPTHAAVDPYPLAPPTTAGSESSGYGRFSTTAPAAASAPSAALYISTAGNTAGPEYAHGPASGLSVSSAPPTRVTFDHSTLYPPSNSVNASLGGGPIRRHRSATPTNGRSIANIRRPQTAAISDGTMPRGYHPYAMGYVANHASSSEQVGSSSAVGQQGQGRHSTHSSPGQYNATLEYATHTATTENQLQPQLQQHLSLSPNRPGQSPHYLAPVPMRAASDSQVHTLHFEQQQQLSYAPATADQLAESTFGSLYRTDSPVHYGQPAYLVQEPKSYIADHVAGQQHHDSLASDPYALDANSMVPQYGVAANTVDSRFFNQLGQHVTM